MFAWITKRKKSDVERQWEALSAYTDGALSPRKRAQLERELAQDPALCAELDELRRTLQLLRSAPLVPLPRHFTLDPAVYGRVRPSRVHLYPILRTATVLATVLFVFLFAGNLFLPGLRGASTPMQSAFSELEEGQSANDAALGAEETGEGLVVEAPAEAIAVEEVAMEKEAVEAERVMEEATVAVAALPVSATVVAMTAAAIPSPALSATEPLLSQDGVAHLTPMATDTVQLASPLPTEARDAPAKEAPVTAVAEEPTPVPRPVNWFARSWIGASVLALGLLLGTLLARRFGW